jgi:hypothetical protein
VHIILKPEDNATISFLISREKLNGEIVEQIYCQGTAELHTESTAKLIDSQCRDLIAAPNLHYQHQLSATECYQRYHNLGISYGPAHQGIERLYVREGEVLARLCLPEVVAQTRKDFVLHPSILDSALQACIGLQMEHSELQEPQASMTQAWVPFELEDLSIMGEVPTQGWAWVRHRQSSATSEVVTQQTTLEPMTKEEEPPTKAPPQRSTRIVRETVPDNRVSFLKVHGSQQEDRVLFLPKDTLDERV